MTTSSVALAMHGLSKEMKKIDLVTGAATTDLTGNACSPYGFHWAYDTHALAVGTGGALVEAGGDSWFFMTADYAFGYSLEQDTGDFVTEKGGKVVDSVRLPLNSTDFSSFLLQAQSRARRSSVSPTPASTPPTRSSRPLSSASCRVVSGSQACC